MSELPAGDTHDVIRHSGQVVAVVVPIEEYQQLRQAMHEQQVNWEIQALDQTAGFLRDDPIGVAALWDTIGQLADESRPPESFPYGSPDLRRLRAGRYRVFYTIEDLTLKQAALANG
jgi:mRNA interferase RelE/StbE